MSRPSQVIINLSALRHNLSRVRQLAPNSKIISAIKADAYGHGLTRVARALPDTDAFGVACIEEAEQLRQASIVKPVLLLEGFYSASELSLIEFHKLDTVIHHEEQLRMLESCKLKTPARVWLKIDTGMHRLGFDPAAVKSVWQRLQDCKAVHNDIRLISHLATASEPGSAMVGEQLQCFDQVCTGLEGLRSMANSAGVINWPQSHYDLVRPGLMLYGVSPIDNGVASDHDLKPVMSLQSQLISVKQLKQGDTVGYGAIWTCPEDMPVGIVATGYGDGFPRHAKSGTPVVVDGKRCQLIGNPSMDMLAVDLRNHPQAKIGDTVELWGDSLPIEEIAKHASTIPYELLCGMQPRIKVIEHE